MRFSAGFSLLIMILLAGCSDSGTGPARPSLDRVLMVPASKDTSFVETGIRAVPESDYIQVEWQRAAEDLFFRRYRLERTDQTNPNFPFEPLDFELLNESLGFFDTTYTDSASIDFSKIYYYRVTVVNVDEVFSEYSDTVHFQLGPKPTVVTSYVQTDTTLDINFSIDLNNEAIPEPVYLRLYKLPFGSRVLIVLLDQERFYNSSSSTGKADFLYSELTDLASGRETSIRTDVTEPGKIGLDLNTFYQVRVDYIGPDAIDNVPYSGAKSRWVQFKYDRQPEN